jgi:hypothetical protein
LDFCGHEGKAVEHLESLSCTDIATSLKEHYPLAAGIDAGSAFAIRDPGIPVAANPSVLNYNPVTSHQSLPIRCSGMEPINCRNQHLFRFWNSKINKPSTHVRNMQEENT